MHTLIGPIWVQARHRRARRSASCGLWPHYLYLSFRRWWLLLLALIVVVPTPASAQGGGLSPTCTLSLQGSAPPNFLTITAVVNCIDHLVPPTSLTTTIFWGDGSQSTSSDGLITVTHTYATSARCFIADILTPGICQIMVLATDSQGLAGGVSGVVDLTAPPNPPPVFAGQTSVVQISLVGLPENLQVTFACTTVTDSNGGIHQAADLGITCNSNPPTIILTGFPQTVSVAIQTTGSASASLAPAVRHGNVFYALFVGLPALFLLTLKVGTVRTDRSAISQYVELGVVVVVLLLLFSSCGGGFAAPKIVQATPAGSYQVTIIDQPVPGQTLTGFVQTSLIVPLTVNQVQ